MDAPATRGRTLVVLCSAEVMLSLDAMVVTVALPSIGRELGFSAASLQWVVTAYTLTLGSFLLLGGRIADGLGHRRTLLAGLALFTTASVLAGTARTPGLLLAARALGGFGGALAIPAALALITETFPHGRERDRALGIVSAGIDAAGVLGAVAGGLIVAVLGWPWVFFLVAPIGCATLVATPRTVAETPPRRRAAGGFDIAGAVLAASGLAALILALTRAESDGIAAAVPLAALGAAAVLLVALYMVERRAAAPLIAAALLRRRRAIAACTAIVANAGAFSGTLVLSTLYMQRVLGFSALEAGLGFVALALSAGAGGPLAAPLLARFGVRRVVVISLLVTAGALVALSRALALDSYATTVLPVYALIGFTFATAAVPLTAEAVAEAGPDEQGAAAGLFQTFTHVGGAVVLAVLAISAAARSEAAHGATQAAALVAGYRLAFALAAILLALAAAAAFALLRSARRARPRGGGPRCPFAARRPRRSARRAGPAPRRRRA